MDLPGIYSLSPYTLEEVVARNYLIGERPDGILNIIDGTNLERNLYLTTQLTELGIPVVVAINMMDVVERMVTNRRGTSFQRTGLQSGADFRAERHWCERSGRSGCGSGGKRKQRPPAYLRTGSGRRTQ